VRLLDRQNLNDVAHSLGIGRSTLARWRAAYRNAGLPGKQPPPSKRIGSSLNQEWGALTRLRKEAEILRSVVKQAN
jgi:transposase-like protein